MVKQKIFITGSSGFLGSAILFELLDKYEIASSLRQNTNLWRCEELINRISWINVDDEKFIKEVVDFSPDIIIHSAWTGVDSNNREDWEQQIKNFELLGRLFTIASLISLKKFIMLGSQAEYENSNKKLNERSVVNTTNAYATCKVSSQIILETFCKQKNIDWYWLRIFSVFGPKEDGSWFVPSMIINQLKSVETNLTFCEQRYDYLYIDDFSKMVFKVVSTQKAAPGIYNICSGQAIPLKKIVNQIKQIIGNNVVLNFGAIPYRINQSMRIEGDNNKFNATFGAIENTPFNMALKKTITYYKASINQ